MGRVTRKQIVRHLGKQDQQLAKVLKQVELPKSRRNNDLYHALLYSIISQQLSVKAASSIANRFMALFDSGYPDPRRLEKLNDTELRAVGVSRQKAGYLRSVAVYALEEGLEQNRFSGLSDEEVIERLTQIKGVGRWTVEMLLMFVLNRPDVLPVDDVGIQNAMKKLYNVRSKGPALRKRMVKLSEPWRPYRTYACKLLWRWKGQQFPL